MDTRINIKYTNQTLFNAFEGLGRGNINQGFKAAANAAAMIVKTTYKATVPRTGKPGPALADSIGIRCRIFKNGYGAYAVVGEKIVGGRTMVKNFHVQENGSDERVRKRIGGKYAWVETVLANEPDEIKNYKRRTGLVVGQHWLRDIFVESVPSMTATIASQVKQRLMVMWTNQTMASLV